MTQVTPTYVLEVDWDNDGTFGHGSADITGDTFDVECARGRDFSQPGAGAVAGSLSATLRNDDGKYSPLNASSPLAGLIVPGIKVKLRVSSPTAANLWSGYISSIEPYREQSGAIMARLRCVGAFAKLSKTSFRPPGNIIQGTDLWIGDVLDYVGWPAGDRRIDSGSISGGMSYSYVADMFVFNDRNTLDVLKDLESIGQGFIYEGLDFEFVHEAKDFRLVTARCLSSQATFSDDPGGSDVPYMDIVAIDPLNQLFNVATAAVQNDLLQALDVLWSAAPGALLPPGQSMQFKALYPNDQKDQSAFGYVTVWTTPVAGTDLTVSGGLSAFLSVAIDETLGNSLTFTVTNTHPTETLEFTTIQARGTYRISVGEFLYTYEDAASITAYGRREFPINVRNAASPVLAVETAGWNGAKRKDPHSIIVLRMATNRDEATYDAVVLRELSDRVTLIADNQTWLGIPSGDFYVERITHRITNGNTLMVSELTLSATDWEDSLWILGTSELGIDTVLA